MNRSAALVLNIVLPGTGLLLRTPGWIATIAAIIGVVGWSLLAIAWLSPGIPSLIPFGWAGLAAYTCGAVVAGMHWLFTERPSSNNVQAINPLFDEIAGFYLANDLTAAEAGAKRLIAVAGSEPGAWRLLGMILRAQGSHKRAERAEHKAHRLEANRG